MCSEEFKYQVYDEVQIPSKSKLYQKYLDNGLDSTLAYSYACDEYEKLCYHGRTRKLHVISDEEKKNIPKSVLNKPTSKGKYFWRASAFQSISLNEDDYDTWAFAILMLGNLRHGDKLLVKLNPNSVTHTPVYLTFDKYVHKFPTDKYYIHSETLYFTDADGNRKMFKGLPTNDYTKGNNELVRDLADMITHWNLCRLNNRDSLFGDFFSIIQRERCFYVDSSGVLSYKDTVNEHSNYAEFPYPLWTGEQLFREG